MKGLTAKVWRTYNASLLFQKEIDKIKPEHIKHISGNERLNYLISMFNQANTSVALLCNHQKNVNTNADTMISKINIRLDELKKKKAKVNKKDKLVIINNKIALLKLKKDTKLKMKNVSLGTSKNNYIDPRIIFSFIKRFDIPPEKLFTSQLIKRFEWANKVSDDYSF
jgi:DNA topoisomerase-1